MQKGLWHSYSWSLKLFHFSLPLSIINAKYLCTVNPNWNRNYSKRIHFQRGRRLWQGLLRTRTPGGSATFTSRGQWALLASSLSRDSGGGGGSSSWGWGPACLPHACCLWERQGRDIRSDHGSKIRAVELQTLSGTSRNLKGSCTSKQVALRLKGKAAQYPLNGALLSQGVPTGEVLR